MKKNHKIIFACLLLPLLLAGCGLLGGASPTPGIPAMPPPNTGMLPPRGDEDPLDIWRRYRIFKDTKVLLPDKAVNFPVLIVDHVQLDWEALEHFVRMNMPGGDVRLNERASYFKDTHYPDKSSYGDRYSMYTLESDVYDTEWGQETVLISEYVHGANYHYRKWFMNMPLEDVDQTTGLPFPKPSGQEDEPEDFGPIRYGEQEAASLMLGALREWGLPADELEVQLAWAYDESPNDSFRLGQELRSLYAEHQVSPYVESNRRVGEDGSLKRFDLPYGGRGVSIRFRHMLYDIPVFDSIYQVVRDPENSRAGSVDADDPDAEQKKQIMLAPSHYESEDMDTQARLVPAWCFFDAEGWISVIIDASTAEPIKPSQEQWEYSVSQP